jgi:hypothetical protein
MNAKTAYYLPMHQNKYYLNMEHLNNTHKRKRNEFLIVTNQSLINKNISTSLPNEGKDRGRF